MNLTAQARAAFNQLMTSARQDDWRGWDPYDALSSPLIRALTFSSKWMRIAWIQAVKRSIVNLRPWLGVPKLQNPKALALFASSAWRSDETGDQSIGAQLLERLLSLRSAGVSSHAWGYPFDWQSRAFFAPRHTPNVIVTTFCGHAFLDGYEKTKNPRYLEAATAACRFILEGLNRTSQKDAWCFSYTPLDHSCIHNANLLASAFLCRTGSLNGQPSLIETGFDAARFSLNAQRADGSWVYGEAPNQQWVDHFHTGYNLMALNTLLQARPSSEMESILRKGLRFYTDHFFLPDGTPRYYANETWPVDIHSSAQAILTLSTLSYLDSALSALAEKVLSWTLTHMVDMKTGHFYFQKHRRHTIKTPFLRWADAWMARALASHLHPERAQVPDVAHAAS